MSEIDYGRLRSLTARELIGALIRYGFYLDRQSGSHSQYYHEDGRRVAISFHRCVHSETAKDHSRHPSEMDGAGLKKAWIDALKQIVQYRRLVKQQPPVDVIGLAGNEVGLIGN